MRVLFVTNRYPTEESPGSSPAIEQQRRALQQLGHDVDLLFIQSERFRIEYLRAMWRVFWLCEVKGRYDVVHAHYGYCGIVARMQWRSPVVVTFRGSDIMYSRQRPISRLAARLADSSIVMTEEMRQTLGLDARVIPYGIDLEIFQPRDQMEARRRLGLPADVPIVLFPYAPSRVVKRFDLVEEAMAIVKHSFPEARLLAIHDKPPVAVADYMNAADVMVLASNREGAPSAVKEAMGCNLPIVSVDVGDVATTIAGIEGCHLVEQSPEGIAEKVTLVLNKRTRTRGRSAVFSASTLNAAGEVASIYERVSRHSRDRRPTRTMNSSARRG